MTPFNFDESIFQLTGKYNTSVKLTESDIKSKKVKIYCKESYAQDMYNILVAHNNGSSKQDFRKDLQEGSFHKVRAKTIAYAERMIYAETIDSGATVTIPFREFSKPLETLAHEEASREFLVMIYKANEFGEYFASEKKALFVSYKQELFDHVSNETWFEVKITRLIKGCYLALYKKEVECFIPGSHAAANVVHNFGDLLGKTLTVMVDNYDSANNLFILSYKKYVTHSMPLMISELQFDKEYVGVLTNRPYDFGVFVEIDSYYTGLIHKSEFENYEEVSKRLKSGDKINVYVKDVTTKNNQYRVVLTLNKEQVNSEKMQWQSLRNRTENQSFRYSIDEAKNSISINIDGENFEVSLRRKDLERNLTRYPMVKVFKVDPINKRLRFEFVEESED